jgi:methoxymalonate biosynthesis protein
MSLLAEPAAEARSRAEFREFVDTAVVPYADDFDRAREIPASVLKQAAERGYFGAVLPTSVGGSGMDMVTLGVLHEEIGRGCSSLRSLLTVHTMVASTFRRWATGEARERWLAGLASGDELGAFCLTEPGAGSDMSRVATTAIRDGEEYVLNGVKQWITGGQRANVFMVFARTGRGLSAFVVDADNPGARRTPVADISGTRASMLAEVLFTECRVPAQALLGAEGAGSMIATAALDLGRYSVAAGCVGILQACLDASVAYTASREQGGALLRDHQLVRRMISDMVTGVHAARSLCRRAGELKDNRDPATLSATWIAKYFASTSAMRAATDAVQLHGAIGCRDGHPVNRLFRDAKVMEIIEGSTQIQQLVIAEHAYESSR